MLRKILIGLTVGIILGSGVYFFIPKNEIVVDPVLRGNTIRIKKLHLRQSAFVIILQHKIVEGEAVITGSDYLPAGRYKDLLLTIDDPNIVLGPGILLVATLFEDSDKNNGVGIGLDKQITNIFGEPVEVRFQVSSL